MEDPIDNAVQSSFSDAAGAREATFRATGGIVAAAVATWALAVLAGGTTSYLLATLATLCAAFAWVQLVLLRAIVTAQRESLREMARRDPLSGVYNHGAFIDILDREFARSRRYGHALSVLVFDVDFFKRINDGYGHAVGDEALRAFARVLQAGLRNVDAVGRLGSEEFAVMLPNTALAQARQLAERLREDAAAIVVRAQDGAEVRFTTSAGVTEISIEDVGLDDMLRRVDTALGRAKDLGRNRVAVA